MGVGPRGVIGVCWRREGAELLGKAGEGGKGYRWRSGCWGALVKCGVGGLSVDWVDGVDRALVSGESPARWLLVSEAGSPASVDFSPAKFPAALKVAVARSCYLQKRNDVEERTAPIRPIFPARFAGDAFLTHLVSSDSCAGLASYNPTIDAKRNTDGRAQARRQMGPGSE